MTHTSAPYQTVLLVQVEAPDAGSGRFRADQNGYSPQEELVFVRTTLLESGACRESRIVGEKLLGLFINADAAVEVACAVQRACAEHRHSAVLGHLHMLLGGEPDHLVADSRHASGAWSSDRTGQLLQQLPAGQIFVSRAIVGHLGEQSHAGFRRYEHDAAHGVELYQLVCHEETVTRMAGAPLNQDRMTGGRSLCLRWRDNTLTLLPDSPSLTIGRSDQADIQIESELASRIHARVGFHETNFLLADQSTNGTFVQIGDDDEVYLHHEQIVLRSSGVISLGQRMRGGRGKLIYFNLTT